MWFGPSSVFLLIAERFTTKSNNDLVLSYDLCIIYKWFNVIYIIFVGDLGPRYFLLVIYIVGYIDIVSDFHFVFVWFLYYLYAI